MREGEEQTDVMAVSPLGLDLAREQTRGGRGEREKERKKRLITELWTTNKAHIPKTNKQTSKTPTLTRG